MNRKSKGINAERELIHQLWGIGIPAVRVAGSGSMKYPSPDIIAFSNNQTLIFECKASIENKKYISNADVNQLIEFANKTNSKAYIAVKFTNKGWFFVETNDLIKTKENYVISLDIVKEKKLDFQNTIKKYKKLD